MTDSLLAVDPGQVTGWSLWALDDDLPIQRLDYGLVKGGYEGWLEWMEGHLLMRPDVTVFEKFNAGIRSGAKDYTALEIQGATRHAYRALALELQMQAPSMKALCPDADLRRLGFWITPAEARSNPAIEHVDGRDVMDSFIHALVWAKLNHPPTVAAFWPERVG